MNGTYVTRKKYIKAMRYNGQNLQEILNFTKATNYNVTMGINQNVLDVTINNKVIKFNDWVIMGDDIIGFEILNSFEFNKYYIIDTDNKENNNG